MNSTTDSPCANRILCDDDRRGIYSELTPAGNAALKQTRPTHDATLVKALEEAAAIPELAPLVSALHATAAAVRG